MHAASRRRFLQQSVALLGASAMPLAAAPGRPPNFIVIFCDDMGYGDLGCFGSTKHRTPNLDRMAQEGRRFTSFYVTSGVCTPSRASLLTGCYPRRVDMHVNAKGGGVLFPVARKGLNPSEVTIAEVLKPKGYATGCIGKWHLGDQREFLPTRQGFDSYFGLPYSNDMMVTHRGDPPLPLLRNETVIEAPVGQDTLTKRYTEEALQFIRKHKAQPFFLYLPHSMVHNPVHASDAFRGKSANGRYGDAVEEIDWSTGQILHELRELGLAEHTMVVFTSDNGAHSRFGGSNLPLSGYKGSTMEGGMREPCLVWWPGHVPAGTVCDELCITMDLLPTFARLADAKLPGSRLDGRDIWDLMRGAANAKTPHEAFYYYRGRNLEAVRSGRWKLHLSRRTRKGKVVPAKLFDIQEDIAEKRDLAAAQPEQVKRLLALAERARTDLGDGQQQGEGQRSAALVVTPVPLLLPGAKWPPEEELVFRLKPNQEVSGKAAPNIGKRPFTVEAHLTTTGDGVILAHGGLKVGYALIVQNGCPAFVVRRDWEEIATIEAEQPLPEGTCQVRAELQANGKVVLSVDGQPVAKGKVKGLLPGQPAEPCSVGKDAKMRVGDYPETFAFQGRIQYVEIKLDKR